MFPREIEQLQERVGALDQRLQQLAGNDMETAAELRGLLAGIVQTVTAVLSSRGYHPAAEASEEELGKIEARAISRAVAILTAMVHAEGDLETDALFLQAYETNVGEDAAGVLTGMSCIAVLLLHELAEATGRTVEEILQEIARESAQSEF